MRNLIIRDYGKFHFKEIKGDIESFDFEEFSNTLYILTKSKIIYSIKLSDLDTYEVEFEADLSNDIIDTETILGIKYILELEGVILVGKGGEIFKFTNADKSCESVGCIESGIVGFSVAPNQEQIIVATGNYTLISFDTQFDVIAEVHIDDSPDTFLPPKASSPVFFSWKPDAKFFACNYETQEGRKCLTRSSALEVFKSAAKPDPEGGVIIVVSVSENPLKNLRGPICWQPTGNFIAGVDQVPVKGDITKTLTRVIFWEKNGLRHLEFSLPNLLDPLDVKSNSVEVLDLLYNKDSDFIAVHIKEQKNGRENILLYHRSNYRWYLKNSLQSINDEKGNGQSIIGLQWCQQNSKRLIVTYQSGSLEIFDFSLTHSQNVHDTANENNLGLVVSVDNNKLLTTVFKKTIMPPPMSNLELQVPSPVMAFSVGKNYVCAACEQSFEIFSIEGNITFKQKSLKNSFSTPENRMRHLQLIPIEDVYSLFFVHNKANDKVIVEIILDKEFNIISTHEKIVKNSLTAVCPSGVLYAQLEQQQKDQSNQVDDEIERNYEYPNYNYIFIQNSKGTVFKYYLNNESKIEKHSQFEIPVVKMQATFLEGSEMLFGISVNNRLLTDSKVISTQATSFTIYDSFLIFTQNTLGIYQCMYVFDFKDPKNPLSRLSETVTLPAPDSKSLNVRNIERGSLIVSLINDKLVFQMPRGNLEIINHRILFLRKVKKLIDCNNYNQAFELCRTNKLDLNIIFDLNPEQFINRAKEILTQFKKSDYINLLIAQIKNGISDEIQYCVYDEDLQSLKAYHSANLTKKVNTFCDTIITALSTAGEKYLYSKFTAHIRKEPSELEYVLNEIKKMKDLEQSSSQAPCPPHLNPETNKKFESKREVSARTLLQYVCWLADAEKIYEVSLSTYDLELVAMAAEFTHKDPKEYIPYFEMLKAIENQVERRCRINMDLKKYDRAVIVLAEGNEEQKKRALSLVKQHNLFNVGLKAFKNDLNLIKEVKIFMGEDLASKKEFQQSLLTFESVQAFDHALSTCKKSGDFKRALIYTKKLGKSEEETQAILKEILHELLLNQQLSQAGKVYKKLGDLPLALETFIKASNWSEMTKTLLQMEEGQEEIKNSQVIPALELAANLQTNLLKSHQLVFIQKFSRLKIVQHEKRMRPQLLGDLGAGQGGQTEQDMISDISESTQKTTTTHTSYTFSITTGQRKKKEKKPKNLLTRNIKEGSPIEEEYLVENLLDIQNKTQIFTETKNLIQYLVYFNLLAEAEEINKEMKSFEETINVKILSLKQQLFLEANPEAHLAFPLIRQFDPKILKPIEVFLNNFDHVLQ